MPILVSGISGFPQAHTQSYKRFATVVKKWGKHWNAISAPNVAYDMCLVIKHLNRCQRADANTTSQQDSQPKPQGPGLQYDRRSRVYSCQTVCCSKLLHTMRAPWPASLREMPWGSAITGHVHTPSAVSVHKTSWLDFMRIAYRIQNKEQWLLVSSRVCNTQAWESMVTLIRSQCAWFW